MNYSAKSLARYISVQAIYQKIESGNSFDEIMNQFSSENFKKIYFSFENFLEISEIKIDRTYFEKIFKEYANEEKKILELIKINTSENWNFSRLPSVLIAILISAISEMKISPSLSLGVLASEYMILTETFFLKNESSFVNALISKIYNSKILHDK